MDHAYATRNLLANSIRWTPRAEDSTNASSEATELACGDGPAAGPAVLVLLLRDRCGRPAGTKPSRSASSGAYSRATPEALDAHDSTTWHTHDGAEGPERRDRHASPRAHRRSHCDRQRQTGDQRR